MYIISLLLLCSKIHEIELLWHWEQRSFGAKEALILAPLPRTADACYNPLTCQRSGTLPESLYG